MKTIHHSSCPLLSTCYSQLTLVLVAILMLINSSSYSQTAVSRIWTDTFGVQDTALKTPVVTDAQLNTYIAGTEINSSSGVDILLRKLDEHGDLIWQTSYTNSGAYRDQAADIVLDDSGNVYLCGASYISGNHYDLLVLKFNSSGTFLWDYTFNGSASLGDGATAIAIDSSSVFVTGAITNNNSYIDYVTLRISSSGSLQWQSTYNFVNLADVPFDITISDGNVFVSGGSQNSFSDWDYASIQLRTHNGTPVDTSRTGGTGIGFDYATEAVCDDFGNYYITGAFQNNSNKDFRTIKFDADLNVLWSVSYDHDGEDDEAFSLTVDLDGNVYVAGTSRDSGNAQFTIVKYDSTGSQEWVHRRGGLHYDKAARITCDAHGNVYTTGERHNSFNADFYTVALDESGHELWYKLFNGASNGNDRANMILVKDEFILVSGTSNINGTEQYITIAYGRFQLELPPDTATTGNDSPNYFYPQLGQIQNDTSGTAEVQYYTLHHGPALFIKDEQMSFVWAKTDTSASTQDTLQRIDQVVFNASETRLYEYSESESYLNYYLPHCSNGITNVHGYKWLSIPEIYREVNLYYTFNRAGLKQLFVSKPGKKPTIELKYFGADTLIVDTVDGSLEIKGEIGSFKFAKPYAYELDAQGNIIPGTLFYPDYHQTQTGLILIDNISYNVGNALVVVMERSSSLPPSGTISQDNLKWSTFFGGSNSSNLNDVVTDINGNVHYCGNTYSNLGFPNLTGVNYTLNGDADNFVTKLNDNVVLQWTTFFGGNIDVVGNPADENVNAIAVNDNGTLLSLVGWSSSNDMPIIDNSQTYYSNDNTLSASNYYNYLDAVICEMNNNGIITWLTYFGAEGRDGLYDVKYDHDDNIIAVGQRNAGSNLTNAGALKTGNGSLIKFDNGKQLDYSIAWDSRVIHALAIGDDNSIYTTGWTRSSNMIVTNFDQNFNSGSTENYIDFDDGFVTKFESDLTVSYSFYIGGSCNDRGCSIDLDGDENVFVAGTAIFEGPPGSAPSCTTCSDNIPIINGFPFTQNSINDKLPEVFFMKLAPHTSGDVTVMKCSYYGGGDSETFYSYTNPHNDDDTETGPVLNDVSITATPGGSFFIAGNTRSCSSTINSSGSPKIQFPYNNPQNYYNETDLHFSSGFPQLDGFIATFNPSGDLVWTTYFGSTSTDIISSIHYDDSNERIFLCGGTLNHVQQPNFDFRDFDGSGSYYSHYVDAVPQSGGYFPGWAAMFEVAGIDNFTSQVNNFSNNYSLSLFPNPSIGSFYIKTNQNVKSIELLNTLGQRMDNLISVKQSDGLFLVETDLPPRYYTIRLLNGSDIVSINKLIIRK